MATIVGAVGGGSWTTGATWVGGVAPTAADDVQLTVASGNVTVSSGAVCRSLDCTGYIGTLTHTAAVTLTIGDATAGAGNVALKLVSGMTYTLGSGSTSAITFVSTSTTQQTVSWGGKGAGPVTFNGTGGSWIFQDVFSSAAATLTLTAGALDVNSQTVTVNAFSSTNTNVRTLTLGSSAFSSGSTWSFLVPTNLTFNPGTSTITLGGTSAQFASGSMTFNDVILNGSGTPATGGTFTCANFTRTGTASKTDVLSVGASFTVTGTLTLNGNSVTNRVLVFSNTVGTARTITAATVVASNVDFVDITGAGAGSWNLSAITGNSGNGGGNTGITFTTAAAQTWSGTSGGNWSSNAWTSRVPLPQDDAVISAAFSVSQTVTADMPRLGRSIDFTGATGSPTFANSIATTSYGSLTLIAGMTFTMASVHTFAGRGIFTVTSAGMSFVAGVNFIAPGGTYTLQDAFIAVGAISHSAGTLTTNNQAVTAGTVTSSGASTVLNLGSSTVSLTSTAASAILFNTTSSATVNAGTSNLVVSTATSNNRIIVFSGRTIYDVTYTVSGSSGKLTLGSAGVTSGNMHILHAYDASSTRTVEFWNGITTTIAGLDVNGTPGNLTVLQSATSGSVATVAKTSGFIGVDYVSLKDLTATGGASWYAGDNSVNVSNNTGWFFYKAPTSRFSLLGV